MKTPSTRPPPTSLSQPLDILSSKVLGRGVAVMLARHMVSISYPGGLSPPHLGKAVSQPTKSRKSGKIPLKYCNINGTVLLLFVYQSNIPIFSFECFLFFFSSCLRPLTIYPCFYVIRFQFAVVEEGSPLGTKEGDARLTFIDILSKFMQFLNSFQFIRFSYLQ